MAWHPDGRRLVYRAIFADGHSEVTQAYLDGRAPKLMAYEPNGSPLPVPGTWAPDGRLFLFVTREPYVMNVYDEETGTVRVIGFGQYQGLPTFSRDGKSVAMTADGQSVQLMVMENFR